MLDFGAADAERSTPHNASGHYLSFTSTALPVVFSFLCAYLDSGHGSLSR